MQDFRQLDVWVKAHQMTLDVYRMTDGLPKSEVFGVTVQLRRAAISVATRIAEGCGKESDAEFALQLQRARAGAFELEYLLLLCRDLTYLPDEVYEQLLSQLTAVKKMIAGLLRRF
jgi:four helix bundle protein